MTGASVISCSAQRCPPTVCGGTATSMGFQKACSLCVTVFFVCQIHTYPLTRRLESKKTKRRPCISSPITWPHGRCSPLGWKARLNLTVGYLHVPLFFWAQGSFCGSVPLSSGDTGDWRQRSRNGFLLYCSAIAAVEQRFQHLCVLLSAAVCPQVACSRAA